MMYFQFVVLSMKQPSTIVGESKKPGNWNSFYKLISQVILHTLLSNYLESIHLAFVFSDLIFLFFLNVEGCDCLQSTISCGINLIYLCILLAPIRIGTKHPSHRNYQIEM